MYRPRLIPALLLQGNGLVKTIKFGSPCYIGDALHAVHLFNQFKADELLFLDIKATREQRCIDLDLVKSIGEEANMPFAVGGGITTVKQVESLLKVGAERVVVGTSAARNPKLIKEISDAFGSSTLAVCVDIKHRFFGGSNVVVSNGKEKVSFDIRDYIMRMQDLGAGELIIQSVDRDGAMNGYNIELIASLTNQLTIPITAMGGLDSLETLKNIHPELRLNGYAAGSLFVYQGAHKGVLINYPNEQELADLFH
jgi:cyclase